jgi:hypothetical protein
VTNIDVKPVAVCVALDIDKVSGMCVNQPLNSQHAQGTPFYPDITIVGSSFVGASLVDDHGNATVPICWPNTLQEYVQDYIDTQFDCGAVYENYCSGSGICVNDNWWFARYGWTIDRLYVVHVSYQFDYDKNGNAILKSVSPICRMCTPGGDECGFSCVTMTDTSACVSKGLLTSCDNAVDGLF